MPTTPAGGASEAATSIPTAAPDTKLLLSDCTRFKAPAAPAIRGSSTATADTLLVELMEEVTICLFGLVVEQDLLRREGHINAVSSQLIFNGSENLVLLIKNICTSRRLYPPTGADIHGTLR